MSNRAVAAPPPTSRPAAAAGGTARGTAGGTAVAVTGRGSAPVPTGSASSAGTTPVRVRTTPQRLRWWNLGTIAACALLALASVLVLLNGAVAMRNAAADTQQQIRMQNIRANLLRADALATNAFLVGGLEPAEQRSEYDRALSETSDLITAAAAAQPADREALTVLARAVINYAGDMEQARANNRQGFPVGAAYLASASAELRGTAIPVLDALATENQRRAAGQMSLLDNGFVEVAGAITLLVLIMAMVWTARRFRRVINPGLTVATALVLVGWVLAIIVLGSARATVDDVRNDAVQTISAAGVARSAASEAKVQESLRLIARGSGAAAEQEWNTQAGYVREVLDGPLGNQRELSSLWNAYASEHRDIATLDSSGRYEEAVERATAEGDGSANATFAAFDAAAAQLADRSGQYAVGQLDAVSTQLWVLLGVTGVAAIGAAVGATVGLRQRLREYL